MVDEDVSEAIWSMHGRGYAVSEIARKLRVGEGEVRDAIRKRWRTQADDCADMIAKR